jgi:predicted porin
MKKTLIALAALAATGAFAQVSVYGRLDAGYAMTTDTVNSTDYKANGVMSHNSVSSMWGIQGSEDLGGGMKANFKLEQDLYTANGNTGVTGAGGGATNASGFNRTSLLGVSGGFGAVSFGRDYNPVFKLVAATDINGLSRVSTVQLAAATGTSTVANQVIYNSPVFSGFQVNIAYGNDDRSTTAADSTTKTTNVSGTYANGPLMVGLGFGTTEQKAGVAGATSFKAFTVGTGTAAPMGLAIANADKITGNVLGASYDFGSFKLVGNYITSKGENTAGSATATELNIGGLIPVGKVTVKAQLGTNKLKVDGAAEDYTGSDFVLGADYALSAKTALFATTGTFNKLSGNGSDQKSVSTAVGIKTVF